MKCEVGDWTYIEDGLPEPYTTVNVACRAKDGSRPNWVAFNCLYSKNNLTKNPFGIPILDIDDRYEAYAWVPVWCPKPPKEKNKKGVKI